MPDELLARALALLESLEYDEYGIPECYPTQLDVVEVLEDARD